MATLSSDGKYVTVVKGDTLWSIASKHLGSGSKYQQLATWNNISNPNLIYVGQKIYLSKDGASSSGSGSGSGSSSSSNTTNSNTVTFTGFGLQSNSDNTLFATWTWAKEGQTANYQIEWTYDTGNGVWFISSSSNTVDVHNYSASRQSTYSIPANAKRVRVCVKPVSKTYTSNNKETTYWTAQWSGYKTWTDETPLATPNTPSVELKKYDLTASLEGIAVEGATKIEFQVYKKDGSSAYKTGTATIAETKTASYKWTVDAGYEYMVRCRATDGSSYSEWSAFSSPIETIPAASSGITTVKANSETSVYLEWTEASTATSYDIEYTTKKTYFDGSDQTTVKSGIEFTHYEITGLESGQEYFFRVRAVNEKGQSAWSDIVSVTIGEAPSAPTTWSSTTTGITGETVTLYWVHNAIDGSSQTYAELEITTNGVKQTHTIKNSEDEDEKDKTSFYVIDTTSYNEGTKITWRVRTAGITKEYGDWSVERTIDIYAPPTLELQLTDMEGNAVETMTSFPMYIYGLPGPNTQAPNSYHVTVTANESYETVDNIGNPKVVSQGEEVYSRYFDVSQALLVELLPSSIDLENGVNYTVTCIVSMNSGLTATESKDFSVSWTDELYTPNAEISYDEERYVTHVRPYCMEYQIKYYKVDWSNDVYSKTEETIDNTSLDAVYTSTGEQVYVGILPNGLETYYCQVFVDQNGNPIDPICYRVTYSSRTYTKSTTVLDKSTIVNVLTSTGEEVLMGMTDVGDEIRYCVTEGSALVENITLSVYRREYDGSFTEIATGLNNLSNTYVTDPHPALDYARYRVVAISDTTGAVSYYDVPGYPIGEVAVIIQWDEEWSNFDTTEAAELQQPAWTGSLLRLPYNIDVSDSNSIDVAHVQYIGRKHPVSYYGTQLGIASNWSMEIDRNDKETLYALRRLAIWMGDVYVREPSGSGYWASIKVSFSQNHCEVTIPVSLDITRVEGGV